MIRVIRPGVLTTVQDLGRGGYARFGVSPSGAADRPSHRLANRLVGNRETAATLETTFGGLEVGFEAGFEAGRWIAVTGAPVLITVSGRAVSMNSPIYLVQGERLCLGPTTAGVRTYLAVRGGVEVDPVLGSRSTDTLAHLGPPPLAAGDRLPVGRSAGQHPNVDIAPVARLPADPLVRLLPGPRVDWLAPGSLRDLVAVSWQVSQDSNRVGVRLQGPPLRRQRPGEIPPEGVVRGAVQVPPNGQPIVFLADHPVTGGYPVVAVVMDGDLPLIAQVRPGHHVRFRWVGRSGSTLQAPLRSLAG